MSRGRRRGLRPGCGKCRGRFVGKPAWSPDAATGPQAAARVTGRSGFCYFAGGAYRTCGSVHLSEKNASGAGKKNQYSGKSSCLFGFPGCIISDQEFSASSGRSFRTSDLFKPGSHGSSVFRMLWRITADPERKVCNGDYRENILGALEKTWRRSGKYIGEQGSTG